VNNAYKATVNELPEPLHSQALDNPKTAAALFGYCGTRAVIKGIQWAANRIIPEKQYETFIGIQKACIPTLIITGIAHLLTPEGIQAFQEHQVYLSGMIASSIGAIQQTHNEVKKYENNRQKQAKSS